MFSRPFFLYLNYQISNHVLPAPWGGKSTGRHPLHFGFLLIFIVPRLSYASVETTSSAETPTRTGLDALTSVHVWATRTEAVFGLSSRNNASFRLLHSRCKTQAITVVLQCFPLILLNVCAHESRSFLPLRARALVHVQFVF